MDVDTLKVVELRKELRARGLSASGDKAELVGRLRAAVDEELVLETETETETEPKGAVAERSPSPPAAEEAPPPMPAKKIVLNRTPVAAPASAPSPSPPPPPSQPEPEPEPESAKQTASRPVAKPTIDSKTRLEMRAKRFGLPPTADALKEARKARFGSGSGSGSTATRATSASATTNATTSATLEALRRRAERFGTNVSPLMVDAEHREKLERRKTKFQTVGS